MALHRGSALALLLGCCLIVAAVSLAQADDAAPAATPAAAEAPKPAAGTLRVAIVDVKAINELYVKPQTQDENTAEWARRKQSYVDELQNRYMYLSESAFNDVLAVLAMAPPRPADAAKKLRDLQDVNDKNEARYLDLQRKVNRSPEEQDEFNRLQAEFGAREAQVKQIVDSLQKQLNEMQMQTVEQAMRTAQEAIAQTATEAGYQLVFSRGAVLLGGDDITEAVLARLGITPPETPAAPQPLNGE